MTFRFRSLAAIAALVPLTGCVTKQDLRSIQTDLYSIQQGIETRLGTVKEGTDTVQTSQADLLQEIRQLSSSLSVLQTDLNDYQDRISRLSVRLDDLEASLSDRMNAQIELLSGSKYVEKPLPSTMFNLANTDFARGKYDEAIKGYQSYVKQFPKGDLVPEARLKIGDADAKLKNYDEAIASYDELIRTYPKNAMVPTALLRKAAALEAMNRKSAAREVYGTLVRSYPYSAEGKTAQDRLHEMAAEGR